MSFNRRIVAVAGGLLVAAATSASAADFKLPSTIAWTSYNVGTSTYNQAVAIGSALKNTAGVDLRIVPGKNDISRQLPVRQGRIPFSSTGLGALYSQEAMYDFSSPRWGPQEVRMIAMCVSDGHAAVITAKDAGIRKYSDLKGKRVTWVRGAPSLNGTASAMLAFGGLTWKDVTKVEVPGFVAAMRAILNRQADAGTVISTSGFASQIEASPRGVYWPPMPFSDKAAWNRLWKVAPWLIQQKNPIGAGIPKNFDGVGLAYPYIITYPKTSDELVYNMTKAIHVLYDKYKDGAPGAKGYALDRQKFDYLMPWHKAAIRYYKEAGVWTDQMQAHNDKLLKRQQVLVAAWKALVASKIGDEDAFRAAWLKRRTAALEKAGFDPIWH